MAYHAPMPRRPAAGAASQPGPLRARRFGIRWRTVLAALALGACGTDPDFIVPPGANTRFERDLAATFPAPPPDLSCFNNVCGGCSVWANWDGSPAQVGNPCGWNGTWACSGTTLTCTSAACPPCGGAMSGSVCGADGHTIVELVGAGASCHTYDFGSAIAVCNRAPGDHCVGSCTQAGGQYPCAAHCAVRQR